MSTPWSDSPITAKTEDRFGRARYAERAADLIAASHSWEDSVVFGLTGPWGSGKSSLLAMGTEELARSHTSWRVARFTPWATNDTAGLLGDFFASLSSALPKQRGKQVRQALGTLAQLSAPAAGAIPWAGPAVTATVEAAGARLQKQTPWSQAFQKATSELEKLNTPVLIIADDIDRLQAQELLAVLKVVRLLGRFPGVHYLLAYDEATLSRTLSVAGFTTDASGTAGHFMEKIVQYPLVVPPLVSTQLLSRLDAGLDDALRAADRKPVNSSRLGRLRDVYLSQLSTPRAVDRYLAQVRHHLPLVETSEIDDVDVIILTLFRTVFPDLYVQLPRWRSELTSGHTDRMKAGQAFRYEPFQLDSLLRAVSVPLRGDAEQLLHAMFPKLKSTSSSTLGAEDRRISNKRYFDRYFAMGIPAHDVPNEEVGRAVDSAAHGAGSELRALLTQGDADRIGLVIDTIVDVVETDEQNSQQDLRRLAVLKEVIPIVNQIPDSPSSFLSPRERLKGWTTSMISKLTDNVSHEAVLNTLGTASSVADEIELLEYVDDTRSRAWMDGVVLDVRGRAIAALREHMALRDAAPHDDRPSWLFHFLRAHGNVERVRQELENALNEGSLTLADIAARFVTSAQLLGAATPQWRLHDFDQERFEDFAPNADDPWYHSSVMDVEETDRSWANRRRYATGRARQPKSHSE